MRLPAWDEVVDEMGRIMWLLLRLMAGGKRGDGEAARDDGRDFSLCIRDIRVILDDFL